MYAHEEAQFEKQAEKNLKSQRELPSGRDFRCFTERGRNDFTEDFRKRFDDTFPNAPGSDAWIKKKFKDKKGITGFHSGGFLG